MSGFRHFCLCVTAVCTLIATELSPSSDRNVSKKLHHKGRDVSRKRHLGGGDTQRHRTEVETPLFSRQEETTFPPAESGISWYSCGDGHCRCKGSRADCSSKNLSYIPQLPLGVTILDFSRNNIHFITDDVLVNVTGLTTLDLSFTSMAIMMIIIPDAFRHLTNLTHLDLSYNDLTTDAVSVVFNIPTLEKLEIVSSVRCAEVEDIKLMHPMPRLQELRFGHNILVTLNLAWFLFFPGLTRLEIDSEHYDIRYTEMFNHQSLHKLSNLSYLDMSSSRQSCDALRTVLTIRSLEVLLLRVASNCSVFCDIDILTPVPRLQELDLGYNFAFEDLNLTCLSPFTGITRLLLTHLNDFTKEYNFVKSAITDYHALHLLPNLTYLDLSYNAVSCDDRTSVLTIPSLQTLIMSASTGCARYDGYISLSLIQIDLSYNELTHLNFNLPHAAGSSSPLQVLKLQGNLLKSFTPQTCHSNSSISMFPSLDTLDMSENSLSDFNEGFSFRKPVCLPRIKSIDLRSNLLCFWYSSFAEDRLGRLETLDVSNQRKDIYVRNIKKNVFKNLNLKILKLDNNGLAFAKSDHVDADCFSGCPNLIRLSLSDNDFKGVSEERFHQLFDCLVHLRELSLRSTGMSFVTVSMFQGLTSLQKLDLSKNSLAFLPDGVFQLLPNLNSIAISANKISVVRESTFSFTTRLRLHHVDLSENPFDCSCQVLWFQKWLLVNPSLFADSSSAYTCGNLPGTKVQSFFMQDQACLLSPETSKFIIATISLIFVGMSLLSFLYRYRWHIRLVLHEVFRGPGDRLRRLREHRFEYDVFVSYDSEDFPWVRDHLMPSLERRMGLKVCIHHRDFIPGCPVVENIMRCLSSSKKMLMLFSRAFIESQWCQFELQLCLTHAMDTEDALIVVMLEDILSRDLTPSMLAVMKTTTYIEWADEDDAIDSFWRRMRLALNEVWQNA